MDAAHLNKIMDNLVETIEHKNHTIEIHLDTDAANPFKEFDELSDFKFFLRNYDLNTNGAPSVDSIEDFEDWARRNKVILTRPVYAYIHSGMTVSLNPFSCGWDSGFAGFAFITRENVKKLMGWGVITKKRKAQLEKYLESDVKSLDSWLQGETYGYRVFDANGEEIDSCWGFYSDISYCIEEAKSVI